MARGTLLKRLERAEESAKALSPLQLSPYDEDALAIYSAMSYLDATMDPTYHEVEPTAAYKRGQELRDALYGPIIPAHDDEHLRRYTRAFDDGCFHCCISGSSRTQTQMQGGDRGTVSASYVGIAYLRAHGICLWTTTIQRALGGSDGGLSTGQQAKVVERTTKTRWVHEAS